MTLECYEKSGEALSEREKEWLWQMLKDYETEFVPPLSERGGPDREANLRAYYEMLLGQEFVLMKEKDQNKIPFAAFLSYVPKKWYEYTEEYVAYMSTAIVLPECRGHKCLQRMYEVVFKTSDYPAATRTWSTHAAQMHLLPKLGFRVVKVVRDDRGPGVDSVYFIHPKEE